MTIGLSLPLGYLAGTNDSADAMCFYEAFGQPRDCLADLKDNGNGTVSDTTTGLAWTLSADLAKGGKDAADTKVFVAKFNASAAFGHKDWRLPTREEMLKLADPANREPALPNWSPFESVSGWYRTSTPDWGVDMDTGIPWSSGQAGKKLAKIWLVREAE